MDSVSRHGHTTVTQPMHQSMTQAQLSEVVMQGRTVPRLHLPPAGRVSAQLLSASETHGSDSPE